MSEKLTQKAITPMTQSMEESCVPTAISMVFSGFGVNISEQTLVDKYFPTAKLPQTEQHSGVNNLQTINGLIQIITDLGLGDQLQIDVFDHHLCKYSRSSEDKFIVKSNPRALRKYQRIMDKGSSLRDYYEVLEQLVKVNEIKVYTANARKMNFSDNWADALTQAYSSRTVGFYLELIDFIKKGHIVGTRGGLTWHANALDGSNQHSVSWKPEDKGFVIYDPHSGSYIAGISQIVQVSYDSIQGDQLLRLSPKENESLNPQEFSFGRLMGNIRNNVIDLIRYN